MLPTDTNHMFAIIKYILQILELHITKQYASELIQIS